MAKMGKHENIFLHQPSKIAELDEDDLVPSG
jgi:hypothetical protein